MSVIEAHNISKSYPVRSGARALLGRGGLATMFGGEGRKTFNALEDVSLRVEAGESLGIIGRNGSGKSTLLKMLAGVTLPTTGEIRVEGRVASLLELGAGFHPMLTGRENVYLNAGLLGMRHAAVDEVFDAIVAFSGIGEFIDQPVDTYSSGMYVRIAFAVAVHANPDIFLIDEVLAVGDEEFQRQCRVKIGELKESGKTIVFVSHDLGIVNTLCDRVILLDHGKMIARDSTQATIDFYLRQIGRESGIHSMKSGQTEAIFSHGRLAVFKEGHEVTAPGGWTTVIGSMGQQHHSGYASWEIESRSENRCRARGKMQRLPATLVIDVQIENDVVHYRAAVEMERAVAIEFFGAHLLLPSTYSEWCVGEKNGQFPDILPGDLDWVNISPPAAGVDQVTLVPKADTLLPALELRCESGAYPLAPRLDNTEYMTGARLAAAQANVPASSPPLEGTVDLFALTLDLARDRATAAEALAEQRAAGCIESPRMRAEVQGGALRLCAGDTPITSGLHVHLQLKVQGMWCLSQSLVWSAARRDGDVVRVTGESLRFPFRLCYTLQPEADGLAIAVHLEATTALQVEEYNFSMALQPGYRGWKTEQESGSFPDFDPAQTEWHHLNDNYAAGTKISAAGPELPSITLCAADESPQFHMSAVQTPADQQSRVLQAIAVPERNSHFSFAPGEHLLFTGHIRVGSE